MAVSVTSQTPATVASGALSKAYPSNTLGNGLLCSVITAGNVTCSSVSDTAKNLWLLARSLSLGSNKGTLYTFWCPYAHASAGSNTVTAALSATTSAAGMTLSEVSGLSAYLYLETNTPGTSIGTTTLTQAATAAVTADAVELVYACIATPNAANTYGVGGSYASAGNTSTNVSMQAEWLATVSTGTQTANITRAAGTSAYGMIIVSFRQYPFAPAQIAAVNTGTTAASQVATFGVGTLAGSLLTAVWAPTGSANDWTGITDSGSGVWSPIAAAPNNWMMSWYRANAPAGITTVTVSLSPNDAGGFHVIEWAGLAAEITLDTAGGSTGAGTSLAVSGTTTTSQAGELVLVGGASSVALTGFSLNAVTVLNQGTPGFLETGYLKSGAAGTTATNTITCASSSPVAIIGTFPVTAAVTLPKPVIIRQAVSRASTY